MELPGGDTRASGHTSNAARARAPWRTVAAKSGHRGGRARETYSADRELLILPAAQSAATSRNLTTEESPLGITDDDHFNRRGQRRRDSPRRRAGYNSVNRKLHDQEIPYSMLFPARLRMVTPTGTMFFSTPEDAWSWLESQTTPDLTNNAQQDKKLRCTRSRGRQITQRSDPPNPDEVRKERRRVVEAVAMLGGRARRSNIASPSSSQKGDDHSDSDNGTQISTQSSIIMPMITPGTSDEII
ncbi:hypothetical protein NDU88_002358 [Pleurodeles waltl]|uniref:Uncharacterized protein n=1 Tax=Pleurodeles waltl TaxID=8319 RepID=A0AAV7TLE5_PLEWA|nr:hypothetical protein NDU88_002358 [Pleurodeles waltl]